MPMPFVHRLLHKHTTLYFRVEIIVYVVVLVLVIQLCLEHNTT